MPKKTQLNRIIDKELIMSEILSLDLPLFLLVDLSTTFDTLNEYKIKNISYNKLLLIDFLKEIQEQYNSHITQFASVGNKEEIGYLLPEHTGLLTQRMLDNHLFPHCNAQQACSIKCIFSVKCLLMIKECINKRENRQTLQIQESGKLGRSMKQKIAQLSNSVLK